MKPHSVSAFSAFDDDTSVSSILNEIGLSASGGLPEWMCQTGLDRRCLPFYLPAGLAISLGMVAIYYALDLGRVVVVIPLSSTGPLFTLILTAIFLKGVERVTLKIVLGAALIISGAILLTLWK